MLFIINNFTFQCQLAQRIKLMSDCLLILKRGLLHKSSPPSPPVGNKQINFLTSKSELYATKNDGKILSFDINSVRWAKNYPLGRFLYTSKYRKNNFLVFIKKFFKNFFPHPGPENDVFPFHAHPLKKSAQLLF